MFQESILLIKLVQQSIVDVDSQKFDVIHLQNMESMGLHHRCVAYRSPKFTVRRNDSREIMILNTEIDFFQQSTQILESFRFHIGNLPVLGEPCHHKQAGL